MPRPAKGAVQRAVTATVEYGVARAGIAAVHALDHDVIGQAHHPRGAAGHAAREIEGLLTEAGFTHLSTQTLPLSPPVACVLGARPAPDASDPP